MFLRIGGNWLTGIDESVALLLYCFIALLLYCSVSLRISERWTLNQTKTSSEWIKCENSSYRKSRERYPPSKCYFVGRSSFFRISHFAFCISFLDSRLSIVDCRFSFHIEKSNRLEQSNNYLSDSSDSEWGVAGWLPVYCSIIESVCAVPLLYPSGFHLFFTGIKR